jgi:hypothetical protein
MEEIEAAFNGTYDAKKPFEVYFMQVQEACRHGELMGQPFTDEQTINRALKQFELQYGYDATKAEKKWYNKPEEEQTWTKFKEYWKHEIHQWEAAGKTKKQAHNAVDIEGLAKSVSALQAETRSLQEDNTSLAEELRFERAYNAQHTSRRTDARGDNATTISELTTALQGLKQRLARSNDASTNTAASPDKSALLKIARQRNPKDYAHLNDGKGKRFTSYCWKCGCNCTHWTRRCYTLSESDRKKYRDADFDNLMGGSTQYLDRRGKHQSDFGFDSL